MSDRIWHKGPPPHVGWWNAAYDYIGSPNTWSWWNGRGWSLGSQSKSTSRDAAARARILRPKDEPVHWSEYYPKNARVPRIDPRKKK